MTLGPADRMYADLAALQLVLFHYTACSTDLYQSSANWSALIYLVIVCPTHVGLRLMCNIFLQ